MFSDSNDDFERLDRAMEAAGMAWWEIEFPTGVVFFAENKAKMLGYKPDKFFHYTSFTDLIHPDDHQAAMQAMIDHMEGRADYYEVAYRIKTNTGEYKTFYDRGKIVQKKDGVMRIAGVVVDIEPIKNYLNK